MHWHVTKRCHWQRYALKSTVWSWLCLLPLAAQAIYWRRNSLDQDRVVLNLCPRWIPPHLCDSFFTSKFSIIITPAFVVKMKWNIEEKCFLNAQVLCKSLFIFFRVALDLALVHFMQILSKYCFSACLLRKTCGWNLCVDPLSNPRGFKQMARWADPSLVWPGAH